MPEKLLKDVLFDKVENSYELRMQINDVINEIEFFKDSNGNIQIDEPEFIQQSILQVITDFVNQNYTPKSNG